MQPEQSPPLMPQLTRLSLAIFLTAAAGLGHANDLVRTSAGASGTGSGGVALLADDPLAAMSNNPAMLSGQARAIQFAGRTLAADGRFAGRVGQSDTADRGPGVLPELAFAAPLENSNITLGGIAYLRSAVRSEFDFLDTPGTGGVSYGEQRHMSEHVVLEVALGAGFPVTSRLSIGGSLGVLYNRNRLDAPYIFQTHPVLAGLKVLVDLEADDVAASARLGAVYQLTSDIELGIAWSRKSDFDASGDLSGNLAELGLGIQPEFSYQAGVSTASPETFTVNAVWDINPRLSAGLQVDRIDWSEAFDVLPIDLTRGSNQDLNDFLGSDSILDIAPLRWDDQIGIRAGVRYELMPGWIVSAGAERDDVPVPEATFTPMTGAILEQAVSLGLSMPSGSGRLELGYRYSRGSQFRVDASGLAGGEYSGSKLDLAVHALVISYQF